MAKKGQKRPKKAKKGVRTVQKYHETVQNLSNETAEKWLKMSGINAKGPTVEWSFKSIFMSFYSFFRHNINIVKL